MKNFYNDRVKKRIQMSLLMQAIIMNFFVFLVSQIFFEPEFETNDDNYISSILYGVYGNYDTHLVYMNVFLGKIIKLFLVICPKLPWYTIIQYGFLCMAFTSLIYIVLKEKEGKVGYFLCWVMLIFFGYECYVEIQYSKTAGVVTIAGILLIYTGLKAEKINKIKVALGFILALIGSLYRFEIFCMVLPIVGIMILIYAFYCIKNKKYNIFLRFCIFYIPLFVICYLFKLYDTSVYNSSPEWKEYRNFDEDRIELLDYGFPDYDENRDVYQKLEITKSDLDLYSNWNYADTELFTEDVMEELASVKPELSINWQLFSRFFSKFPVLFLTYKYFTAFLLFFILWLLDEQKNKIAVILSIAIGLAIELYFYSTGRYFINRVDMSIIMGMTVVMLYQIETIKIKKAGVMGVGIIIILVSAFFNEDVYNVAENYNEAKANRELFDIIEQDKENLYLVENYTSDALWTSAFSVWDLPRKGISQNYYTLGGWRYDTPLTNYILQLYDVQNPYRDVVDNSKIYIIDDYDKIGRILKHIQTHYAPTARVQLEKIVNGHKFYKIYSQDITLDTKNAEKCGDDIEFQFSIGDDEFGNSMIQGYIYKEGTNSFKQEVYIGIYDESADEEIIYPTISTEKSSKDSLKSGRYSWFMYSLSDMGITDINNEMINVYLKINNKLYVQEVELS